MILKKSFIFLITILILLLKKVNIFNIQIGHHLQVRFNKFWISFFPWQVLHKKTYPFHYKKNLTISHFHEDLTRKLLLFMDFISENIFFNIYFHLIYNFSIVHIIPKKVWLLFWKGTFSEKWNIFKFFFSCFNFEPSYAPTY